MKCIIAGSRSITSYQTVKAAIESCPWLDEVTEVVTGGAQGVDTLGDNWAWCQKIDRTIMKANWEKHGKAAGPIRNKRMADYVGPFGGLILVWDGQSAGSKNMKHLMRNSGHVWEVIIGRTESD
jgi:hypothetical protein